MLHENVECPSISPDNSRIAFKKRVGDNLNGPGWRFHVLDLETMTETPLAETRSIDDQIMWLDNEHVLYGDGTDTWVMPADGSGQPERFMSKAISPVILPNTEDSTGTQPGQASAGEPTVADGVLTLPEADIGVDIDMPDTATAGNELTYTVAVTNNGPQEATSLVLDAYLPDRSTFGEVRLVDPPDLQYGCSTYLEEHRVRCETASLAPDATWTVAIVVTPEAAESSTVWANAGATETDLNADNDHARVDFTIAP
jgi:uncharacterized repeat protein (TIGR01451 family)